MSDFVAVDAQRVDQILATLSDHQTVKDILNEGLESMADVYYNEVVSSLRKKMGAAADTVGIKGNGWNTFNFPLSSGIQKHPDPDNSTFGVHALKDFRLLFFEGGTKPRYTKGHKIQGYQVNKRTGKVNYSRLRRTGKPGFRGVLPANHFFTEGVTNSESRALDALLQGISQAIRNRGIEI